MPKRKKKGQQADAEAIPGKLKKISSSSAANDSTDITERSEEHRRLLDDDEKGWKDWGPYLSERQWGTVREDYSNDGNCWEHFSHDASAFRAYRWGEDGLFGLSDSSATLCLALALWNGQDDRLKERLFGLTGPQGNHGEDVKECYYYLESTPTHSYSKALYKYPQRAFPYGQLLEENARRGPDHDEYELIDTGVFSDGRYWDVFSEYAKLSPSDILCQYTLCNRGSQDAAIHVVPQLWYRNTWSWDNEGSSVPKPLIRKNGDSSVMCSSKSHGDYVFEVYPVSKDVKQKPELMFTENDTNSAKLAGVAGQSGNSGYTKDAFHEYIVKGNKESTNPSDQGTKFGACFKLNVKANDQVTVRCRLRKVDVQSSSASRAGKISDKMFTDTVNKRRQECDQFYSQIIPPQLTSEETNVYRQTLAGLCFTKQLFYYHVDEWHRGQKRDVDVINHEWKHMLNCDIISMPDKWEFPWYATWDLAFHMIPFSTIDPDFAQKQLLLFLNERYQHPNGQLPAYEFNFSDVNPPVHAWACLRVYDMAAKIRGHKDTKFLKKAFHKLMLNFNWWVNKKDRHGRHIFHGGFLGLDNISCVHRSEPPKDTTLEQVDGTCWMAFYSVCMLRMALELARSDDTFEDIAIKFLDHFARIALAVNESDTGLWDVTDGFYYDRLTDASQSKAQLLRVRSLVGLTALFPAFVLNKDEVMETTLPNFSQAIDNLFQHQSQNIRKGRYLLTVPSKDQLSKIMNYLFDESEFLSPYGIRSLSKFHKEHPVSVVADDTVHSVSYCPGESDCDMFGGNSNWRGPVWLCMNYLLLESLQVYADFYGDTMTLDYPGGSGSRHSLRHVVQDVRRRLVRIFVPDNSGKRPVHGDCDLYASDPHWKDLVLFYEYFHGDSGRGCGASHQTGWTALVANILADIVRDA